MVMEDGFGTLDVEMSKDESNRTTTSGEGTSSNAGILGASSTASATGNKNQNEGGRDRSNHNPNEEDECDENDEKRNIECLISEGSRGANDRRVAYFYDCE